MDLKHTIKAHDDPVCTLACTETYLFSGSLRDIKVHSSLTLMLIEGVGGGWRRGGERGGKRVEGGKETCGV